MNAKGLCFLASYKVALFAGVFVDIGIRVYNIIGMTRNKKYMKFYIVRQVV